MPIYKTKLLDRNPVAHETILLKFEKPADFKFIPGQYAGFSLPQLPMTEPGGNTRRFSILSTPNDDHIAVATRIQNSSYKKTINELPIGSEIKLAGPSGNFILHDDETIPAVFLAGGIGIAPFYSIMMHHHQIHSQRNMTLFYGNQAKHTAAFMSELDAIHSEKLKIVHVLNAPHEGWQGETGFITQAMIKKHVADLSLPIFYICGSKAMVDIMRELLIELDIDESRIKTEDFPGY